MDWWSCTDDDISPQAEVSRYFIWQRQHRPKLLPKKHLRSQPQQNLNCQHFSNDEEDDNEEEEEADMEFATSCTSDTCEEYFGLLYNFQELTQKNTLSVKFAEFRQEFSQKN